MTTATLNPGFGTTTIIDERPLSERLGEALKTHDVGYKLALSAATLAGGAAGAGIGYINHIVALAFYAWIGMPAWFMTIATWSGYFAIGYLALAGAWLARNFIIDPI